jgi:hypothetical protein
MGDPDVDALRNEYSGEESPALQPTPDQNLIDAGRAFGVENATAARSDLLRAARRRDGNAATEAAQRDRSS